MSRRLPLPKAVIHRENPQPDLVTGQAIAGLADTIDEIHATNQTGKLETEIDQLRENFLLQAAAGDDPNDPLNQPNPDFVGPPVAREVNSMTSELAGLNNAVAQGLTPVRALEIKAEEITRRYIDRYPGLSTEFQKVANQALGSSGDLLTSTMRAFEEMSRSAAAAAASAETEEEAIMRQYPEYSSAILVGSEPVKQAAIDHARVRQNLDMQAGMLEAEDRLAEVHGDATRSQQAFNGRATNAMDKMNLRMLEDLPSSLPFAMQAQGIDGFTSAVKNLDAEQRVEVIGRLERSRDLAIRTLESTLADHSNMSAPATQARMASMTDAITNVYGSAIDSVSLGQVNEQLGFTLKIAQNKNLLEFELVLGRLALINEKIIALLPQGEVRNKFMGDKSQSALGPKLMAFLGQGPLESVIEEESLDQHDPVISGMVRAVTTANVMAMRESLSNPEGPGVELYNQSKGLSGMDYQFETSPNKVKRMMLDLIAEPEFIERFSTDPDPSVQRTLRSLSRQAREWGALRVSRLSNDLVTELSVPKLRVLHNIEVEGGQAFGRAPEGEEPRERPVQVQDIVDIKIENDRVFAVRKSDEALTAAGVVMTNNNLARVDEMADSLNTNILDDITSFAGALETLDPTKTKQQTLGSILKLAGKL